MTRDQWVAGFWRRVLRVGQNKCWLWTGSTSDGYGQLKREDGQTNIYAHRAAVEIVTGVTVPDNRVVMHSCDNPRCVNPRHLRVATQRANVHDMHQKGRASTRVLRGDEHGSTKVPDDKIAEMRKLWANRHHLHITQEKLAKYYGISQAQVSRILNGKRRRT